MPTPPGRTDQDLMLAVRAGDTAALHGLFVRHHRRLYGFLARMTGDHAAAEDLVQEVFLRLLHHRQRYEGTGEFTSWLFRIARNLAHDHHRARRAMVPIEEAEQLRDGIEGPELALEFEEDRAALEAAIASLPLQHREVLLLRGVEGLSNTEIAAVLGCSDGAVRVRIHRATTALRSVIGRLVRES